MKKKNEKKLTELSDVSKMELEDLLKIKAGAQISPRSCYYSQCVVSTSTCIAVKTDDCYYAR